MPENRTSVLKFKIHDHIKEALHDLAEENCIQIQEIAYQLLLDGLKQRLVKRSHLQDRRKFRQIQGNFGEQK